MFVAVTRSPGYIVIDDIAAPGPPRAGRVVVGPEAVGIRGSDLHLFSGHTGARPPDFGKAVRLAAENEDSITVTGGGAET